MAKAVIAVGALLALCTLQPASVLALDVGGDPRVDPADYSSTLFASGLDFPLSMQRLADGSLLVGVSPMDGTPGGNWFNSLGQLLRLHDDDRDGTADDAGSVLYSGLPGLITSVRVIADLVFVASARIGESHITLLRTGAAPTDALTLIGSVDLVYPLPWDHFTHSLAVRPSPLGSQRYEVFFQLGSRDSSNATTLSVLYSGLASGSLAADAIHRMDVDDSAASLSVTGIGQIATGVRNASGLAFHPTTGDLYFEDNGFDDPDAPGTVAMSDELNRIAAGQLAAGIHDFGFPDHYIDYVTGSEVGSGAILPLIAFRPLPQPSGAESLGASEVAFAPPDYPIALRSGVFVGFHGGFVQTGLGNTTNPVAWADLAQASHFHFVAAGQPGLGHPDGLLATGDSLFVSDFTTVAGTTGFGTGAIHEIRYLPPLPAIGVPGIALLAALLLCTSVIRLGRRPHAGAMSGRDRAGLPES